jgi:hypothetical protein
MSKWIRRFRDWIRETWLHDAVDFRYGSWVAASVSTSTTHSETCNSGKTHDCNNHYYGGRTTSRTARDLGIWGEAIARLTEGLPLRLTRRNGVLEWM